MHAQPGNTATVAAILNPAWRPETAQLDVGLSGLMAGLSGLIMTSRYGSAKYDIGLGLELDAITAVVLGGTDIFGGRGTMFGTVVTFASHANLRLLGRIDRILRWLIVTPSVHVIHHSAMRDETDSNYGAIFTIWDRLFGTYREHQADREASISVQGLEVFRSPRDARLDRVLWHPFAYQTTAHATTSLPAATVRDDGHGGQGHPGNRLHR